MDVKIATTSKAEALLAGVCASAVCDTSDSPTDGEDVVSCAFERPIARWCRSWNVHATNRASRSEVGKADSRSQTGDQAAEGLWG